MLKKTIALGLTLCALATSAFAEQTKVEEYRKILQSGKYYIEYEIDDMLEKNLAVKDGVRMDYTINKGSISVPIVPFGLKIKTTNKVPSVLYKDGKYYQFKNKTTATMATEAHLADPNLDPNEGWSTVKQRLALPEELAILVPDEPFNQHMNGALDAQLVESGEAIVSGKPQQYDKYVVAVKNRKGKIILEKNYFYYYKNGELVTVKSFVQAANDIERPLRTLTLKSISAVLPEGALEMPEGLNVYAAGIGDMDDLLDRPALVESYAAKEE